MCFLRKSHFNTVSFASGGGEGWMGGLNCALGSRCCYHSTNRCRVSRMLSSDRSCSSQSQSGAVKAISGCSWEWQLIPSFSPNLEMQDLAVLYDSEYSIWHKREHLRLWSQRLCISKLGYVGHGYRIPFHESMPGHFPGGNAHCILLFLSCSWPSSNGFSSFRLGFPKTKNKWLKSNRLWLDHFYCMALAGSIIHTLTSSELLGILMYILNWLTGV